jgi:hypothetical protein
VAKSHEQALELFATKTIDATLQLDLNRRASSIDARSPPPMSQDEPLEKEYDDHEDGDSDFEMNDNNVGDLDA